MGVCVCARVPAEVRTSAQTTAAVAKHTLSLLLSQKTKGSYIVGGGLRYCTAPPQLTLPSPPPPRPPTAISLLLIGVTAAQTLITS